MIIAFFFVFFNLVLAQSVVWPEPPEEAKIRYVKSIADFSEYNTNKGLRHWILQFLKNEPEAFFIQPMGIAVNENILAVADPGRKGVFLLSTTQKKYIFIDGNQIENADKFSPIDVALGAKEIVVSSSASQGLWAFGYNGKYKRYIELSEPVGRLTGITSVGDYYCAIDTKNHTAIIFDKTGKIIKKIGGRGIGIGEMNYPTFVTASSDDKIYITDTMNFRCLVFDKEGRFQTRLGSQGLTAGQFNRPKGIAVDDAKRVYVVDNSFDNYQVFDDRGACLLAVGNSGHKQGNFLSPTDISIHGKFIYVSDTMNRRIQVFEMLYE